MVQCISRKFLLKFLNMKSNTFFFFFNNYTLYLLEKAVHTKQASASDRGSVKWTPMTIHEIQTKSYFCSQTKFETFIHSWSSNGKTLSPCRFFHNPKIWIPVTHSEGIQLLQPSLVSCALTSWVTLTEEESNSVEMYPLHTGEEVLQNVWIWKPQFRTNH